MTLFASQKEQETDQMKATVPTISADQTASTKAIQSFLSRISEEAESCV